MNVLLYAVYCMFAFVSLYTDSPLKGMVGEFGASYIPFLSIIFLFAMCMIKKKIRINKYIKVMINMELYLIFLNIISIIIYFFIYGNLIVLGENLIVKSIKCNMYWVSYTAFVIVVYNLMNNFNEKFVLLPFVINFFLIVVISYIEMKQIPYAFENIHYNGDFPYWRIRLFTQEASHTAGMVISYFFITLFYFYRVVKSKIMLLLTIVAYIFLIIYTDSKNVLLLSIVGIVLLYFKTIKLNVKNIVKIVFLGIIIYYVFSNYLIPIVMKELIIASKNSSSVFTRSYTILIGILYGIIFPMGTGNSVYLKIFPYMLDIGLDFISKMGINLSKTSLIEVLRYINATDDANIAVKSGFLQYNMYWGIIGSFYMIYKFKDLYVRLKNNKKLEILLIGFIVSFLQITIGILDFDFWFYVVILMYYFNNNKLK